MKIEKISDNQIKFVLNKGDLLERDIKLSELAYGSEKTQELFREMMEQAYERYDFKSENSPLIIEAIPVATDSIMIIVTKISSTEDIENKLNILPRSQDISKYKELPPFEHHKKDSKTNLLIFSFSRLDEVSSACSRFYSTYWGKSMLYKYQGRFFLLLENLSGKKLPTAELEAILYEYGEKHTANSISTQHIIEHGELIVKKHAVSVMSDL